MSLFKRISTTLFARIDQFVGDIENHEAVIKAAMTDMKKHIVSAKLNVQKLTEEEQAAKGKIQQLEESTVLWRQRAIECGKQDEDKALECLTRSHQCHRKIEATRKGITQLRQSIQSLSNDIQTSEDRLNDTRQKLALLKARNSTSQALKATADTPESLNTFLETSLLQWEEKIAETEFFVNPDQTTDALENEFLDQENLVALKLELAELLQKEVSDE